MTTANGRGAAGDPQASTQEATDSGDDLVTLVRESAGEGRAIVGGNIIDWMIAEGVRTTDGAALFDSLCWRLVGQGVPLWRTNLSIATLHPQIMGIGFRWWRDRGVTQEFRVKHGMERHSDYLESPMRRAIEDGVTQRYRLEGDSAAVEKFPLLKTFRAAG